MITLKPTPPVPSHLAVDIEKMRLAIAKRLQRAYVELAFAPLPPYAWVR